MPGAEIGNEYRHEYATATLPQYRVAAFAGKPAFIKQH